MGRSRFPRRDGADRLPGGPESAGPPPRGRRHRRPPRAPARPARERVSPRTSSTPRAQARGSSSGATSSDPYPMPPSAQHAAREMEPQEAGPAGDRDQPLSLRQRQGQPGQEPLTRHDAHAAARLGRRRQPLTSTAATRRTVIATALSPIRLRPTPACSPRSSRGRTKEWWTAPQASATRTIPASAAAPGRTTLPRGRRRPAGGRSEVRAREEDIATRTMAMRENRRNARRRTPGRAARRARERHQAADPEHGGQQVHPVGELSPNASSARSPGARRTRRPREHEARTNAGQEHVGGRASRPARIVGDAP